MERQRMHNGTSTNSSTREATQNFIRWGERTREPNPGTAGLSRRSLGGDGCRAEALAEKDRTSAPLWQNPTSHMKNYQTNPFAKKPNPCKYSVSSTFVATHTQKRTHFPRRVRALTGADLPRLVHVLGTWDLELGTSVSLPLRCVNLLCRLL